MSESKSDTVTSKSNRDKAAYWLKQIQLFLASGEKMAAFCRAQELNLSHFTYRLSRYRQANPAQGAPKLVPVRCQAKLAQPAVLASIQLKTGDVLYLHDASVLQGLLQ